MAFEDETSPENQTKNQEFSSSSIEGQKNEKALEHFICIKEVRAVSRAKALRLKTGDVIVGISGKIFNGSVEELLDIFDEVNDKEGALLTIWRESYSFNIIIFGPLGCVFETTSDEVTQNIHKSLSSIEMGDIKEYTTFELLRNIEGECNILDTRVSQLGIFLPPAWLIQQKLWEPLIATLAIYTVTFFVHWALFIIAAILLALYFRKAQLVLLRSFSLHKGKIMWMVIAAKTMLDAQQIGRLFDQNIIFTPDLVGPPAVLEEPDNKKKKKKKKRKSSIPAF